MRRKTCDAHWCSEDFELRCEDGAKLSVPCDRERWVASPIGRSGNDFSDLMLERVEQSFGDQLPATAVQWLSDNGSADIAEQTSLVAR